MTGVGDVVIVDDGRGFDSDLTEDESFDLVKVSAGGVVTGTASARFGRSCQTGFDAGQNGSGRPVVRETPGHQRKQI